MVKSRNAVLELRRCLVDPPRTIQDAARYLDAAVSAHIEGKRCLAEELIRTADNLEIYLWLKPIWARCEVHLVSPEATSRPTLNKSDRVKVRMPNKSEKAQIHQRDGHHCRFCDMPVVRKEVRDRLRATYPNVAR